MEEEAKPGFWARKWIWLTDHLPFLKRQPDQLVDPDWKSLRDEALKARRDILAPIKEARGDTGWKDIPAGSMGLALSGGGIRSATISLGVAQALQRKERLLDFDYCSTVSGGGYFGSFFGSLFVPESARGSQPEIGSGQPGELATKADFARDALIAQARDTDVIYDAVAPRRVRNPIWWLREHSRYLAPNGPSDYAQAATYLIRNWLAMLYVFALPVGTIALAMIWITRSLIGRLGAPCANGEHAFLLDSLFVDPDKLAPCHFDGGSVAGYLLSPLFALVLVAIFFSLASSLAYWLTETMSNFSSTFPQASRAKWLLAMVGTPLALAGVSAIAVRFGFDLGWSALAAKASPYTLVLRLAMALTAVGVALFIIAGFRSLKWLSQTGDAFTADVRRRLTRYNSWFLIGTMIALVFALTDTAGMWAYEWVRGASHSSSGLWGTFVAALLPVGAWLINKLPTMFSDGNGKAGKFLGDHLWTLALIVGIGLYGLLAVMLHVGLQALLLDGRPLIEAQVVGPILNTRIWFAGGVIVLLTLLTGWSTPFINLSSLHGIYAARLTRAYLGASNLHRLESTADPVAKRISIKEADRGDQLPIDIYQQTRTAGPLHLINVTLNETKSIEKSQLLERDRKGVPLVFAPEGVFVDAGRRGLRRRFYPWSEVAANKVESLSVGQLCAISGAAASTAMGSRTTLGGALAMTFANIRLGYWWNVENMIRGPVRITQKTGIWFWNHGTAMFRTYFYLWNEMTANYSREHGRLNISDGGHFDNSGAYELLRRDVKTIFVCDNGADPNYLFEDFEQLVRKARIDLGMSINTADRDTVVQAFGREGAKLFLNGLGEDWRSIVRERRGKPTETIDTGLFLLLEVYADDDRDGKVELKSHIVWMKPRKYIGLTQDVIGYGNAHLDFPHETTGDQFFDEAQWESYRALGECMIHQLFGKSRGREDVLRNLQGLLNPRPAVKKKREKSSSGSPARRRAATNP